MHRYFLAGAAAGAAVMLAVSTPAKSADIVEEPPVVEENPWYISLHGGWKFGEGWDDEMFLEDVPVSDGFLGNNTVCGAPAVLDAAPCNRDVLLDLELDTDNGWRAGGAIGYGFSDIFAIEAEVAFINQDFDEVTIEDIHLTDPPTLDLDCASTPLTCSAEIDGDISIITGMINLIAGFPMGGVLRPYVGVGAGVAHVSFEDVGVVAPSICCLDDSDTTFAAQAFAGLDFVFGERWAIGGRYRFLHIGDVDLEDDGGFQHDLDPDGIHSAEIVLTFGL
ncbi:MAG TPA: porin family protein [Aestuariivirgaceae bacterium]|jgi:opacity protein-like surface antigen